LYHLFQYDDSLNLAAEKRGVVQRNLNERGPSQVQADKRALRLSLSATREERQSIQNRQTRRVGREISSDSYQRMVRRFDEVFSQELASFMNELNTHSSSGVVANLGIRLDYNGYVTGTMTQ
jgi:tRNA U34 5-carboxymethylaminomethyl modifying enzyme MnmG/GidA